MLEKKGGVKQTTSPPETIDLIERVVNRFVKLSIIN